MRAIFVRERRRTARPSEEKRAQRMHEKPKNRSQTIRHRRLSGPERLCRMHEKPENQTRQTNTRRVIPENEFNNHTTSAEKPFNSNKYKAPSSNPRKTENHKNQTHAQKAQERPRTERRISKPDNQKNIETTQSTRGVQRSD